MSNRVSSNSASTGAVDYSNMKAGDTFTPDSPSSTADSSNSQAGTSLLDNKSKSTSATDTGPTPPTSATERSETRAGRGMGNMKEYAKPTVLGTDSSQEASGEETVTAAGEATAMAAGNYQNSTGPFSGSGPANKKLEYFS